MAKHGVTIEHLPDPSRRAYRFLTSLDFHTIKSLAPDEPDVQPERSVSVRGIKSYLDGVVAQLAWAIGAVEATELFESIRATSERIEANIQADGLAPQELTPVTRSTRGWLAYFSVRENFDTYLTAIVPARSAFEKAIQQGTRFRPPVIVEFRPTQTLYRIRGHRDETRVVLPTPMICFESVLFGQTAEAAINGGSKQAFNRAAEGEAFQGIQAELEALGGTVVQSEGVHRDLDASFHRVVADYFTEAMPQPRLTWSEVFTGRKFGHYDYTRDTVMISATLDRADVPAYVLDCVMHHELLHKKLGVHWQNGRRTTHTPQFRREERRFKRLVAADAILQDLAGTP